MKTLALPSQTVSFGAGSAEIKKLKVESFESPDIRISLVAPNGLIFSTSGGSIAISGSWNAAYRILWTICKNVRDNIEHLNKELWSIEAQTNVINNVYLSYHLLEDPKITENFIQFDFSVYATFGRRKCYLQPEGKSINNNRQIMSNHMIVLWFGEPIINCYLKTWYETVNHHHVYISNSTDSRRFRNLFNVNCTKTKNCTGKVSDLNKLDLDIQLIKAPLLHAENGIYIETSMKIVFYRSPKNSDSLKLTELSTEKMTVTTKKVDSLNQMILNGLTNVAKNVLKELKLWEYAINVTEVIISRLTLSSNASFVGTDNFIRTDIDFHLSNQRLP
uniref:Lipid-binding serum glycoprotein N-terminal domain-containing protein n=1 Tax=Wuchereria bancrofti TaxID=6293 RepID=A0A1I8EDT2_WUCBA